MLKIVIAITKMIKHYGLYLLKNLYDVNARIETAYYLMLVSDSPPS